MKIDIKGHEVEVGDTVTFKTSVRQTGQVVDIRSNKFGGYNIRIANAEVLKINVLEKMFQTI